MITIRKKNDVYLEVDGPKGELRMMSDYFTFEVPGAAFIPSVRNKIWDGKIRLLDLRTQQIYVGLIHEIAKFSKDFDVEIEIQGSKYDMPGRDQPLEDDFAEGFLKALNVHSKGQPIEHRDYQVNAFKWALRKQRGLILSPTASGKSLIVYSLIRWYREVHERKILVVVPTISLVSQMIGDFADYSNGKFNDVHGITGGVDKNTDKRVVVSTWQSIYKQPPSWFAQFGSVIVDEVHTATAKSLQGIMGKLIVCPDRIGLTGTLQDAKTHELVLKGLFGPVEKMITTKELIDRKQVSEMSIRIVQFDYSQEDRKICKSLDYQEEVSFLIEHEKRNQVLSKMAQTLPGNTLIIFQRIEHGKRLLELIGEPNGKQVFYIAGETDKDARETTRHLVESNDSIVVASMGVFSTGVNIRNLHNLIFAHPSKSKIKVLQSIGRVLRKADDGNPATVYDIVDDLKYGSRDNFALRHAAERFKYYTNENFDYKINKVEIHDRPKT